MQQMAVLSIRELQKRGWKSEATEAKQARESSGAEGNTMVGQKNSKKMHGKRKWKQDKDYWGQRNGREKEEEESRMDRKR